MNTQQAHSSLQKLKHRYLLLRLVEISFLSMSVVLLAFGLTTLISRDLTVRILLSVLLGVGVGFLVGRLYRLHRLNNNFFSSYLNQQFAQLNESADLLLIDNHELSQLQLIQKEKTLQQLEAILPKVKLPHRILQSLVVFVTCAGLYMALSSLTQLSTTHTKSFRTEIRPDKGDVYIKSVGAFVLPPSYTHLKSFEAADLNLTLPEGSSVQWKAQFSEEPLDVKIFFSGKDSMTATKKNKLEYSLTRSVNEPGFYQIQWRTQGKIHRSDFYKLEMIKDQAPKIVVRNLAQFTKLKYTGRLDVLVKSELTDDYGLTDAQIVATVSKGSGEGVKFREEKLKFPQAIVGNQLEASRSLDLKKLGLEPADELYFYVETWDNKSPSSNHSRTETFFIAIQDTATEIASVDAGLGVDLMPEYFRSQRQIIIDTEKLLREKKTISIQQFKNTSNELGFDQKALRLRYGQFLGEEDEAGLGQPTAVEEQEDESDPLKKVTHQHDTKNEHNLVDEKAGNHQHAEREDRENEKDPLKQFVHEHDNTEEATFFIQSLKTKLKAAITQMWDAELYLRLYQPEKSLPYQYKALNLLKEISSDSRIFVHRSGFDPAPLKEEKRLTADLSDVKGRSDQSKVQREEKLQSVRDALMVLEKMIAENSTIVSSSDQKIFRNAGGELSGLASEQPVIFLKGLSLLKSLSEKSAKVTYTELIQLRRILWRALPSQGATPSQPQANGHELKRLFLKNLNQHNHE